MYGAPVTWTNALDSKFLVSLNQMAELPAMKDAQLLVLSG